MSNDICSVSDLDREICTHCTKTAVAQVISEPTRPGLYPGISDLTYHAGRRSISASGLKMLLTPGGLEQYLHTLDHGPKHAAHYDFGHAAHAEVLGTGMEVVEVRAQNWRTNAAKAARSLAYTQGKVPLLSADLAIVREMGAVVRANAEASVLLSGGRAELSAYAIDPHSWVMLRARPDYLVVLPNGHVIVVDYKTTLDASRAAFAASAVEYGYHLQEALYRLVLGLLGMTVDRYVFLAQEKVAPYLAVVHEFPASRTRSAERQAREGIEVFANHLAQKAAA